LDINCWLTFLLQSNIGAKNHAVVMPDASVGATINALVAAGFGGAGQKCMALNMAVFVGGLGPWYFFLCLF
jgi:malonate-semialdehyde dehydrogenase (acetylating)/methylmalonate-semialdehyde dehydrogenase